MYIQFAHMERRSCIYSARCSALLQLWMRLSLCQLTDCCRRGKVKGRQSGGGGGRGEREGEGGGGGGGCTCICMQDLLLQIHNNAIHILPNCAKPTL